jgi:predicted metal-dependent peptidase
MNTLLPLLVQRNKGLLFGVTYSKKGIISSNKVDESSEIKYNMLVNPSVQLLHFSKCSLSMLQQNSDSEVYLAEYENMALYAE